MDNARKRAKQLMAVRACRTEKNNKQEKVQTQMVEAKDVISLINKLESVELKLMLALCRFGGFLLTLLPLSPRMLLRVAYSVFGSREALHQGFY